jgi:tRNA threonylcarbamoyl adenosine modification protein (Sua5/YciO/YrdC/YwlC family)
VEDSPDVSPILDATDPLAWGPAIDEAVNAVSRGQVIVLPTDTVYGVGADAFDARAVKALLDAKGRGRQMPPPVLIPDVRTLDGLATEIPGAVRALAAAFWPGALTVIVKAQPSLTWDLGETRGTVALRVPDHPLALALLRRTGPMAVSSANKTGRPAATSAADAAEQLGEAISVVLDGGPTPGSAPSTIVDATGERLRVIRLGVISLEQLREVADVVGPDEPPDEPRADPDAAAPGDGR